MFTEQLRNLRSALSDDDKQQVLELTDPVMNALEATRTREGAYDKVAQHVRANAIDDDPRAAVDEYLEAAAEAEEQRGNAIRSVMQYLSDDVTGTTAATAVGNAIDTENRLENATDDLDSVKTNVSVPPILAVLGTDSLEIPKGVEISETYTVSNLGTETAMDVTASVTSDLSLSVSPTAIGKLGPEDQRTVTLSGSATDEGQHNVQLSAKSGHVGDVLVVTAVVADKADYVERARTQVQTLRRTVSEIRENATSDGGNGGRGKDSRGKSNGANGLHGVENKLRTADNRLERLETQLAKGRTPVDAVDNQLGSVINTLEAVINQVQGLRPQQISGANATLVVNDAKKTIETLETAQTARP